MKKLAVANMKMNLNFSEIKEYISNIKNEKNVIICPTSIYLPYFKDFSFGVQNVFYEDKGSYTGEISPEQAKSIGAEYAIIGHSERRNIFFETDDIINRKIKKTLKSGLKVILCVGEIKGEEVYQKLKKQLDKDLKDIDLIENLIIAYEPIWSIGTGIIPSEEQITETTKYIKDYINEKYNKSIKVLYGGSVNASNIEELNKIEIVDGFLIGTASTKIEEFNKIIEVTNE